MNKLIVTLTLALIISAGFTQTSQAGCSEGPANTFTCTEFPPNPDTTGIQQNGNNNNITVNMLPRSEIIIGDNNVDCIETEAGNDNITLNGARLALCDEGINASTGNNTINITDSEISADNDPIEVDGSGTQNINVIGSRLICNGFEMACNAIDGAQGVDIYNIVESELVGIGGAAILLNDGNDTVGLGTGSEINSGIDCGDGFDTLVFFMAVPEGQVDFYTNLILSKDPEGDSVVIEDLEYLWQDCEELAVELNVIKPEPRPIPTISEIGLFAMAGALGLFAVYAIRRRKAQA